MKRRKAPSRRLVGILLTAVCAICVALIVAPTASATPTLVGTFDGSDTPARTLGITNGTHVAVDESTGDVWVIDETDDVVDRFDRTGRYLSQITGASTAARTFSFGSKFDDIAVDNSGGPGQGDVYVLAINTRTVFAFDPNGSERWEASGGTRCGIGIDPNGNPWIGSAGVDELTQLDPSNGNPTGTVITTGSAHCHLGFDSTGAVYASNRDNGGVDKIDQNSNAIFSIDASSTVASVGTSFHQLSFFTVGADSITGAPSIRQWDLSGNPISRIDGSVSGNEYRGVAFNGISNLLYVSDDVASNIQIYSVPPSPPIVTPGAPSNITSTGGTVNGTVNADGSDVTDCHVDYETDAQFRTDGSAFVTFRSVPCVPASALTGASDVAVTADLTGLTPSTTYHTRIVATNAGGTTPNDDTTGDVLLTTSAPPPVPTVVTGSASGISQTGATLAGTVNPNGDSVSDCHIQYGTTTSYGASVPCSPSPGSGSSAVSVTGAVTGLTASTTYHFRVVATNSGGTTNGADATFRTLDDTCLTNPSMPQCRSPPRTCPGDLSLCHPHIHLNGGWSWVGSTGFLRVKCSDDLGGTCAGTLTLKATIKVKVKKGHKTVVKKKTITVGTASYSLAVGGTARLKVKLTSAGKSALKLGALTATVTSSKDGKIGSVKIPKLKVRRAKSRK